MIPRALFLAVLLPACGQCRACDRPAPPAPRPTEVAPYADDFARVWGRRVRVPIRWATADELTLTATVAGRCTLESGNPVVLLRHDWWDSTVESERWAIVRHELGHCALGRQHDETAADGCPKSVMFPSVTPSADCIDRDARTRADYDQELFAPGGTP